MAKKIYLSPSNQDGNTYATGNTNEMIQCNKIAKAAETALVRCGFSVKRAPQGQSMYTTVSQSNSWGADLHIPIHTNAYNGNVTGGTLVMVYALSGENKSAGSAVLKRVNSITPGPGYTLRANTGLYELNATNAVAVYVEVEFHDTKQGAKWIINNTTKTGEMIARGVCDYYGVEYKSPSGEGTEEIYRVRKSREDVKSQIGAYKILSNAKKKADENSGYYVFDSKGKKVYSPENSSAPKKLTLKNVPLYISATAKVKSSSVTGTYYRYDNEVVSGRVRITNKTENIGKKGQVTGWVDLTYAK